MLGTSVRSANEANLKMPPTFHKMTPLLQVFDMPKSLAFYRDALGFVVISTSSPGDDCGWAMLERGEVLLMLNTAYDVGERPPTPDAARVAAHDDTGLFFNCDDVDAVHAHLRDKGWDVREPANTYYGMRQVYTKDPDGYALCFQHPVRTPPQ